MEAILKICTDRQYIFTCMFNLFLVFLAFDPMRERLELSIVNSIISTARDLLILLLIGWLFLCRSKVKGSFFFLAFGFSYIAMFILSFIADVDIKDSLTALYWLLRSLLLCLVIYNLNGFYCHSYLYLLKFYVVLACLNFFVSLLVYFAFPEIIPENFYLSRISIGNPSVQSILYLTAFSLVFIYCPFGKSINTIISSILLLAAIATVTATAFVGIAVIFIFTFTKKAFFFKWLYNAILVNLLIIIAVSISGIDLEQLFLLISNKSSELVQHIFSVINETQTSSMSYGIREEQIENYKNNVFWIEMLFGDGHFSMLAPDKLMIENTYWALLKDFGIYGLLVYLLFLLCSLYRGFVNYRRNNHSTSLIIATLLIAAYSFTLYLFAGMYLMLPFFLYFWIVYNLESRENTTMDAHHANSDCYENEIATS